MRKIFILLPCLLVAGCWQSTGSLFGDVKPVQPFAAGKLVSSNPDKPADVGHAVLTRQKDGSYRLASADKGDLGDAMVLRFIALGADVSIFALNLATQPLATPNCPIITRGPWFTRESPAPAYPRVLRTIPGARSLRCPRPTPRRSTDGTWVEAWK